MSDNRDVFSERLLQRGAEMMREVGVRSNLVARWRAEAKEWENEERDIGRHGKSLLAAQADRHARELAEQGYAQIVNFSVDSDPLYACDICGIQHHESFNGCECVMAWRDDHPGIVRPVPDRPTP